MRRQKLIFAAFLFITLIASLQAKEDDAIIGHVRLDYIHESLPEYKSAEVDYQSFHKQVIGSIQDKSRELQEKLLAFLEGQKTMADTAKSTKEAELQQLHSELEVLERLTASKHAELFDPVHKKIKQAIEKVAQEQGYRYVLIKNEYVAYASEELDISDLVLKEIGVTSANAAK